MQWQCNADCRHTKLLLLLLLLQALQTYNARKVMMLSVCVLTLVHRRMQGLVCHV
jgi:hypothetical protein